MLVASILSFSYDRSDTRCDNLRKQRSKYLDKQSISITSMTYDILKSVSDLVEIAGKLPGSTVLIPGGDRVEDLRLIDAACDYGIINRAILVGSKKRTIENAENLGIDLSSHEIVDVDGDEQIGQRTVELVNACGVDMVLKGGISTPIINRAMLKLAVKPTVSLACIFDAAQISGGKPILFSDPGVSTVCNFGRMVDIISNAIEVAQMVMGIAKPKVAILSANEKQIPSLPSTSMGLELSKLKWDDAFVCGPLSFDLATDPKSVAVKGIPESPNAKEVAGNADILICPCLDSANILYKTISSMARYGDASISDITFGFKVPYIILSRSDSLETRLDSIALCSVYAQRKNDLKKESPAVESPAPEDLKRVLVVNPGSMSIKIAVYENDTCLFESETSFKTTSIATPEERISQADRLAELVKQEFEKSNTGSLDAISGRGGFLPRPDGKLSGGTYLVAEEIDNRIVVNDEIVSAIVNHPEMDHVSNLGIIIAANLAEHFKVPAFSVDPVIVDEFSAMAEFSGYKPIVRRSSSHALSVRAAAQKAAESIGRSIENMNLVVAHLGGGITVASIVKGKMTDNSIALLGGGPFTPQRSGQLPVDELIDLCYSGQFTKAQLKRELTVNAGLVSYLDNDSMEVIEEQIEQGDEKASLAIDAMVYQISKEIGAAFIATDCRAEAIILTGGLARSGYIKKAIRQRVGRLAPVMVFAGSVEMPALAAGAIAVMTGKQKLQEYRSPIKI